MTHWVPVDGVLQFVETFLARFFLKLVNDYTGIAHLRHPHEIGGIFWLVSIISTQVRVCEEGKTRGWCGGAANTHRR